MVRHMRVNWRDDWKALLAVSVALGGLLWHLLACVESPMAFSPSGHALAFVTMEPYGAEQVSLQGPHAYRLIVVENERWVRIVEQSITHLLSAPAYSPDGKRLCYLRIPLLTKQAQERLTNAAKEATTQPHKDEAFVWPGDPATSPASRPASGPSSRELQDLTLPPLGAACSLCQTTSENPNVPATLVVRDANTDAVVMETRVELPINIKDESFLLAYLLTRPQYSSDGQWIYFSVGGVVWAISPATGAQRIVAASAEVMALSPDGKLLAVLTQGDPESVIGLVQTDGQAAVYRRWPKSVSWSGVTWIDKQTLALLEPKKDDPTNWLHLLRPDGTLRKSVPIRLPKPLMTDGHSGQLAISPNGRYMVVAFEEDVFFLRSDGKQIGHWSNKDIHMVQPTFSPDSERVAFKLGSKEPPDHIRFTDIAFFSPQGKELSRIRIPPLKSGTTKPAY